MTGDGHGWIVIHNWHDYQHYKDRDPNWIKDYRSQHADDGYLQLSFRLRGVLKDLRLAYASTCGQLSDSTSALTRRFGGRVTRRDLETLNHAGFIEFRASKPLALRYHSRERARERSREKRREEKNARTRENEKPTSNGPRPAAAAYQPFAADQAVDIAAESLDLARRLAGG